MATVERRTVRVQCARGRGVGMGGPVAGVWLLQGEQDLRQDLQVVTRDSKSRASKNLDRRMYTRGSIRHYLGRLALFLRVLRVLRVRALRRALLVRVPSMYHRLLLSPEHSEARHRSVKDSNGRR